MRSKTNKAAPRQQGSKRRPRMARADNAAREALLDEVIALLRRVGGGGLTMRALAAHLGTGASSLYYHFPSRDALLAACLERELAGLVAAVEAAATAPLPPPERVAAILETHIAFQLRWAALAGPEHGRAGLATLVQDLPPAERQAHDTQQRLIVALLRGVLLDGATAGLLAVPDATPTTYALLSLGEHAITWVRPEGRLDATAMTSLLVSLGMRMVSPFPRAAEEKP